jgi:ACS family hexuronate transporter-like MFS transporter
MTAAVSLWTLASIAHVFARSTATFGAARAALGFGEGATFPGGLRTVVQTLGPELRSRGTALAYSGGSLGALITPIVITPIAAWWGWRGAFWFTGGVGALWLLGWTLLSRGEKLAKKKPEISSSALELRWTDRDVWALIVAYSLGAFPLGFVLYQAALYLSAELHLTQVQIGKVLWIPPLGWETGYFFWGWVVDRFAQAGAGIGAIRKQFLLLTFLSLPLAATPFFHSLAATMALMFFAMFVSAGFVIASVAHATHVYSTRYCGLIAGLGAGSWSALVGLMMPWIGKLFDLRLYDTAFAVTALIPVVGMGIWMPLKRDRTVQS